MEGVRVVPGYADQLAGSEEAYVVRLEIAWRALEYECADVRLWGFALGLWGAFERPWRARWRSWKPGIASSWQ